MGIGLHEKTRAQDVIATWPEDSREVAQGVIDTHGEPDEATESRLIWHDRGAWHELIAYRETWRHEFPFPHNDCLESVTRYAVPLEKVRQIAEFDGSVVVQRTRGHLSATCHDEQANFLALNLAHDIASGLRTVGEARQAYVESMVDSRAGRPTPYMEKLQFEPQSDAADPDRAVTSAHELRLRAEASKRSAEE